MPLIPQNVASETLGDIICVDGVLLAVRARIALGGN